MELKLLFEKYELPPGGGVVAVAGDSWVTLVPITVSTVFGMNSKTQQGSENMWRKLFRKAQCLIEVMGPSNQRRIMTRDEYIEKRISEIRIQADLARYGIPMRREADHLEHAMMRARRYAPHL